MRQPTEHGVAAALQRVLLPPGLPQVDSWAMATLYEPAGETVLVGGDFYDWFTLPNGHLLFFIGDVSGKGPLAGALGMSIRKALKGITWVTHSPLTALPILQRALADEFADAFATLCLLELTPGEGTVRVVLAGHPAPWIRRAGRFSELVAPANGMLGPQLHEQWLAADVVLAPGDMLVLFSDGLTEARLPDGTQFGEGAFERFLASLPDNLSSYETVLQTDQHLRRVALGLSDDVIIGVLTFQQTARAAGPAEDSGQVLALRLSPHSSSAALGRQFTRDACRRLGAEAETIELAELVTSELITNAVLHARTDSELRVRSDPRGIRLEVEDRATATSPTLPADPGPPDPTKEHGRGLALVRSLACAFGVDTGKGSKTVWAVLAAHLP